MSKTPLVFLALFWSALNGSPVLAVDSHQDADRADERPLPHWIWSSKARLETESVRFHHPFQIGKAVVSATLRCAGESASLSVLLDGETVATLEPYDPLATIDVTDRLHVGAHRLAVSATSVSGPSAFFLQLDIEFNDGRRETIVSDDSWWTGRDPARVAAISFGEVDSRLLVPKSRRVGIAAVDNYEQWKQALGAAGGTDPASFIVAPGFEIRLVRSARADEDSWISMVFDPQGRLLIAKENQGLLRMTLSADGSKVTSTEAIEKTLKECRGLVFAGGDLFVNANNSNGLYRLRRTDDDRFDSPELLYASSGGVGHGRNDLALGPDDGMIYSIHGDSVDIPEHATDYTSPFRDARRGKKTSEGHLLRIDPANGNVEVLAAGLRNPFGIDFNRHGDIFTYDADAEYDMGSPWYRPTRINHLVTGGDYGWRGVTRSWPSYYPDHADNARPNLDIGKGSPTAVKFATNSNFPARYRDSLFALDWAYGRIIAVHCIPRGSSYLMVAETFLKGRPLNVTDLDFGPDGSMYFVTGGRKTHSSLYQIRYVDQRPLPTTGSTIQQTARREFSISSRKRRRDLEAALQEKQRSPLIDTIDSAWDSLGDRDPWISQAASQLIESFPISIWKDRAFSEPDTPRALKALLSLARTDQHELFPQIIDRLNQIPIRTESRSQKLIALQTYSLCLVPEIARTESERMATTREKLSSIYPDSSYRVNRLLSELMVRSKSADAVAKTIRLLNSTTDQTEQMQYLYVLRGVRDHWTIADRTSYFRALSQSKHYLAGAGMSDFISKIREEAIGTLSEDERRALGTIIDDARSNPKSQPTETAKPRPFVRKWTVEDVLKSARSSGSRDLERGGEMFALASCIACHRVGRRGTLVGPDLTAASRRFSRRDLLTSIIEPSKVIAENYRSVQIVTSDGKTHVGQTVFGGDYRSPRLRLAVDPSHPLKTIEIEKSTIELQKPSPVSWMPAGLMDTLTRDEILDLVAYIEAADPATR